MTPTGLAAVKALDSITRQYELDEARAALDALEELARDAFERLSEAHIQLEELYNKLTGFAGQEILDLIPDFELKGDDPRYYVNRITDALDRLER